MWTKQGIYHVFKKGNFICGYAVRYGTISPFWNAVLIGRDGTISAVGSFSVVDQAKSAVMNHKRLLT